MKKIYLILVVLLLAALQAFSQDKTLDRQYVPIILSNLDEPILKMDKNDWLAYSYNAQTKTWKAVPFQVDEVKTPGNYEHDESNDQFDPKIDNNDEIVFMPEDLGDRAPESAWVDIIDPEQSPRIELTVSDPLNESKKGWIYLFKNVNNPPIVKSYFSYSPPPNTNSAADTVKTKDFILGHADNGFFNHVGFAPEVKTDLMDRLKLRFAGKTFLGQSYNIDENSISPQSNPVSPFLGQVRTFRDVRTKIDLPIVGEKGFDPKLQYFPYSVSGKVNLPVEGVAAGLIGVKLIRLSFDLSPESKGMLFFSQKNRDGINIDGIPDSLVSDIDNPNALNWVMATGRQGTILVFIKMPQVENANVYLYYHDNSAGGSADGTKDTGDGKSFSDMGVYIQSTSDAIKASLLDVNFTVYFINKDLSQDAAEWGDKLQVWESNPYQLTAILQNYNTTLVKKQKSYIPATFRLLQPFPNPYNNERGALKFRFISEKLRDDYGLTVYNILGQEIRKFNNITALMEVQRTVLWDGRDKNGALVLPGMYFYRLYNAQDSLSGKILIVK
ncbi:T9SS type A sorting domain-containing protein [candidate division KSB1 bacterium]|nr:T9SS type A sorting domain-containing protein [candidate division KSB1 bacterium]